MLWIELVAEALAACEDQTLTIGADGSPWTGRELRRRIGGAAEVLEQTGCAPGTPALLTMSPTSLAMIVAGGVTGRPLAPLSGRLTVRELADCLEGLDSPVLLCEPASAEIGRQVAAQCDRRLVVVDTVAPMAKIPALTAAADSTAYVLHTSGTTGRPRRVDVRQDRMGARSMISRRLMQLEPGCVFAASSPFHHIGGLGNLAVALASQSTTIGYPQFSVESWADLARHRVTHVQAIPTILEILLRAGAFVLPTLRMLQYGASPIHPDTLRRVLAAMPEVDFVNLYGQTEGAPLSCLSPDDHRAAAAGDEALLRSVGRAVPGLELRIGEPNAEGIGEVCARADHLFLVDETGWLHTGDLGRIDDQGYLFLAGRRGDMIIRGGENVYPLEVEQVLAEHPEVIEAAVVGVPDDRVGEAVRAFVVLRDPATPLPASDLRAFARTLLAGYKVPEHWEFVPALPRNPNGKVVRSRLPS
jgi:acyl-CoA synthetase (AMP-forming)/AMP-acid ligase II